MRTNKNTDQLVAPTTPAVRFASDEVMQTVTAPIRAQYEQANVYVAQQTTLAVQRGEEIDRLQREISDLTARIEQLGLEKRQHETYAQQGRDVARGVADLLAAAGASVPPPNGELSHHADEAAARWNAAVDEQRATEGVRGL